MLEVERIPLVKIIFFFVLYIVSHFLIGVWNKKTQEQLKKETDNEETKDYAKLVNLFFKWFPAIAVVIVIMYFYAVGG